MGKHIPGPWVTSEHDARRVLSSRGTPLARTEGHGIEANEANARLIASAPALLEALEAMTETYTRLVNSGDAGNWDPETEDSVIKARAAIAAAKGEEV